MSITSWGEPLGEREIKKARFVVALFVGFALAVVLFPGSPADAIVFCPFRKVTGYSCFGCGMTRACTLAVRGGLAESFHHHPFGIPFVLGFALIAMRRAVELFKGRGIVLHARLLRVADWTLRLLLAALVVFGIVRFGLEVTGVIEPV